MNIYFIRPPLWPLSYTGKIISILLEVGFEPTTKGLLNGMRSLLLHVEADKKYKYIPHKTLSLNLTIITNSPFAWIGKRTTIPAIYPPPLQRKTESQMPTSELSYIYYPSDQTSEEGNKGGSCPHPHVLIGRNPSYMAAVNRRYPLHPPQILFIGLK